MCMSWDSQIHRKDCDWDWNHLNLGSSKLFFFAHRESKECKSEKPPGAVCLLLFPGQPQPCCLWAIQPQSVVCKDSRCGILAQLLVCSSPGPCRKWWTLLMSRFGKKWQAGSWCCLVLFWDQDLRPTLIIIGLKVFTVFSCILEVFTVFSFTDDIKFLKDGVAFTFSNAPQCVWSVLLGVMWHVPLSIYSWSTSSITTTPEVCWKWEFRGPKQPCWTRPSAYSLRIQLGFCEIWDVWLWRLNTLGARYVMGDVATSIL